MLLDYSLVLSSPYQSIRAIFQLRSFHDLTAFTRPVLERHLDPWIVNTSEKEERGAGTKGRREVGADSRQRTAPLAGKSLAGAYRPSASARVGSLGRRWGSLGTVGTTRRRSPIMSSRLYISH